MDQKEVKNITDSEVQVMFDGQQIYFEPGQSKAFTEGVALGIANENQGLEVVSDKVDIVKEEVVSEEPVEASNEYSAKENKKGVVQYRKNGKLISKEEYENK